MGHHSYQSVSSSSRRGSYRATQLVSNQDICRYGVFTMRPSARAEVDDCTKGWCYQVEEYYRTLLSSLREAVVCELTGWVQQLSIEPEWRKGTEVG